MRKKKIRGLLVRWPYVEMIASGTKKWELRKSNTRIRGPVALVSRGYLYGFAELSDSFRMSVAKLKGFEKLHRAGDFLEDYARGHDTLYVWVFKRPIKLPEPVKISYPKGSQMWIALDEEKILNVLKSRGYIKELKKLRKVLDRRKD